VATCISGQRSRAFRDNAGVCFPPIADMRPAQEPARGSPRAPFRTNAGCSGRLRLALRLRLFLLEARLGDSAQVRQVAGPAARKPRDNPQSM